MQNPRTRLVSLRLTQEEYDSLRGATEEHGARSISEFARQALLGRAQPAAASACHCDALAVIDERLTRVEQDVIQMKTEMLAHHPQS